MSAVSALSEPLGYARFKKAYTFSSGLNGRASFSISMTLISVQTSTESGGKRHNQCVGNNNGCPLADRITSAYIDNDVIIFRGKILHLRPHIPFIRLDGCVARLTVCSFKALARKFRCAFLLIGIDQEYIPPF